MYQRSWSLKRYFEPPETATPELDDELTELEEDCSPELLLELEELDEVLEVLLDAAVVAALVVPGTVAAAA